MSKQELAIRDEHVINKIYMIRCCKVMLDMDLAELYGVETRQLKRAVRRNLIRFPEDFMFELSAEEIKPLRYQIGTSKTEGRGGIRYTPMAFTEQGVAMLSSILNTRRAISVNIHIIRVFARMRELLSTNKDILLKLEQLERTVGQHDEQIQHIFECLKELLNPKTEAKPIGFQYNKT
ncbi:MAG TPA: ORF6N domain-containing protein [Cyclobacteriaceae bacterium]